jgi:hypothetical protein
MEDVRYPIGKYEAQPYSDKLRTDWLNDIRFLPQLLENAMENLDEAQLLTPYRDGGWTVQQLIHHVADSHINAYCRFRLGLTEDKPTIRPYDEKAWALLSDVQHLPPNVSITLLYALHTRWHELLKNISGADWDRVVVHPEHSREMSLWYLLGMYAWHSKHHVAHITALRERNKW